MTTRSIERRTFLKRTATAAVAVLGAPLLPARAASAGAAGGRPSSRSRNMATRSAGRGRLPVWVVRIRS